MQPTATTAITNACFGQCFQLTQTEALTVTFALDSNNPWSNARPIDVAILGVLLVLVAVASAGVLGIWLRSRV